jgi:branched-chain amino acid transport system permease protein
VSASDVVAPAPAPLEAVSVRRSSRPSGWLLAVAVAVVVVLSFMPSLVSQGDTATLVNVFVLLTIATMWNLLAGYAGMVSIGQQAFIGVGAYTVLVATLNGMNPFVAIPLGAVVAAAFAIATWVVAAAAELVVSSVTKLGGGTGHPIPGLSALSPTSFSDETYWAAMIVAVLALAITYLLLRSRLGLVLAAVRDNEVGARASGARVTSARRIVFMVAALGCGAAGALLAVSQLQVQPTAAFSVQFSAEMIFVTLIGGMGTIEGPIIGTVIFFVLQQNLAQQGAWYLIILGSVAVVVAIWLPRGIWGTVTGRLRFEFFPVGYFVASGRRSRRSRPGSSGAPSEPAAPAAATGTSQPDQ